MKKYRDEVTCVLFVRPVLPTFLHLLSMFFTLAPLHCTYLYILGKFIIVVFAVAAQDVTVTSLSPPPTCPNDTLVYECQLEFQSFSLLWRSEAFEDLQFVASLADVGSMMSTSDGRAVANVTVNEEGPTPGLSTLASILKIQPPLNVLNDTNLTCVGSDGAMTRSGVSTALLIGEWLGIFYMNMYTVHVHVHVHLSTLLTLYVHCTCTCISPTLCIFVLE